MALLVGLAGMVSLYFVNPVALAQKNGDAGTSEKAPERSSGRYVSIDFNDVDIEVFVKFISELTGKNFVIDRRVKGKVTIISPTKISVKEAYKVFESVLEVHGYTTVDAGEVTKIIPSPYARTMNIETRLKREKASPEDKIATQLVHLDYADPNEVKQLCAPLVSKSSVVLAYEPTNMLIITDVYSNITRLMRIIDAIDVTGIGKEISVIPVEHADAQEMVDTLDAVFGEQRRQRKNTGQAINLVADQRTNIIVVMASESDTNRIESLINMLDKEMPRGKEKIHVEYLQHAKAEDIVEVLQELPSKTDQGGEKGRKRAPIVSEDVQITADKATNSLIIRAEKDDYRTLKGVINKLDIQRSMVYIECLIMEINKEKSLRMGSEWIVGGEGSYDDRGGVYGGGYSGGSAMGGDSGYLQSAAEATGNATAASALPPGFSLGVFSENITVGDVSFPMIQGVLQLYQKDKDANILSTPQILTTDNEVAKITVGKNVPYLTKAATGDTNYSNYEYKDVGISLEITPQINKDRQIRLEIIEEVTKLESTTDIFQPTTLKRTIETTVLVDDRNTVVLGGLIDKSLSTTKYEMPCIGSIPGLGWLFKSLGKGDSETNLFVFLTPHVVHGVEDARKIYDSKQKQMEDKVEEGKIKLYNENVLPFGTEAFKDKGKPSNNDTENDTE
ncbi:MAG: type II secretion system secretin GspD [Desulfobacterales bacterium]|nr:type II secretion system secretin GspD [Desulfobacterales bacterium]